MGVIRNIFNGVNFIVVLGVTVLHLFIFDTHTNVQVAPYDTIAYKKVINKLAIPEIGLPFFMVFVFLFSKQWIGILLTLPLVVFAAKRIFDHQIFFDATTAYKRIKSEENITIVKIINLFIVWIYTLIMFILGLVSRK